MKDYDNAEKYMLQCLEGREKIFEPDHSRISSISLNLGELYLAKEDFENSSKHFKKAYENRRKNFGPGHRMTNSNGGWYVGSLVKLNKHEEAQKLARQLIQEAREKDPDPTKIEYLYGHIHDSLIAQGKTEEAAKFKSETWEVFKPFVERNQ